MLCEKQENPGEAERGGDQRPKMFSRATQGLGVGPAARSLSLPALSPLDIFWDNTLFPALTCGAGDQTQDPENTRQVL